MSEPEFDAVTLLHFQAEACRNSTARSPFYAQLLDRLTAQARAGGPVLALFEHMPARIGAAPALRLLGALHREVLAGRAPDLAAHWPGDPDAALRAAEPLLEAPPASLLDALTRDPQTNEVGRAPGLAAGLAEAARRVGGLPIRLFEIGSSAGLNLRLDRFWYDAGDGRCWGDPASPLRFEGDAFVGRVPFGAVPTTIAERRGCDLNPIDATTAEGSLRLRSYVWPDNPQRMQRVDAALEVAATLPVVIDAASADDWVDEHLHPADGALTVLVHSIMWQYLPPGAQERIRTVLSERGGATRASAPLAWVRLEPAPDFTMADVRLTTWPDGTEHVLATSGYHSPPVTWTA